MGCFVLFCVVIISAFFTVCKKLIPLRLHDCAADLPQSHLRDVAGSDAQGVDGGWCVEFVDMGKFVSGEIIVRPQAQPGHQHIGHADLQRVPVERLQIEVIQFLQQAVLPALPQVLQVVREVVCHGVMAGGAHGVREIFFSARLPKVASSVSMTSGSKAGCIVQMGSGRAKRDAWVSETSK